MYSTSKPKWFMIIGNTSVRLFGRWRHATAVYRIELALSATRPKRGFELSRKDQNIGVKNKISLRMEFGAPRDVVVNIKCGINTASILRSKKPRAFLDESAGFLANLSGILDTSRAELHPILTCWRPLGLETKYSSLSFGLTPSWWFWEEWVWEKLPGVPHRTP